MALSTQHHGQYLSGARIRMDVTRVERFRENSGFDKIEVKDNGFGIKQSEIHLAAQPHYTSKLSNEDDLKTLTTYGFRGEALGAICGVSDVVVISKTKSDDVSISHKFNNLGKIISSKPSPHAQGTTVIVQNLFKNIPVRRQFGSNAKKKKEEIKKVEDLVIAFGTIHPNVRFSVYHNHSQIWQKIAVNDIRSALLLTLGTNTANVLEHKTAKDEKNQIKIDAFLPKLGLSIQQTSRLSLERSVVAVNSRPVRIKDIDK
ncbi:PMS1 protein homolog 1-like, partial [Centruroides sculpturatus]|uniref:PMS1 protein homolog 1-like n=1 Tax=Centruroides sculpturatus TaxID=218467 RepID=UPI000C6DFE04